MLHDSRGVPLVVTLVVEVGLPPRACMPNSRHGGRAWHIEKHGRRAYREEAHIAALNAMRQAGIVRPPRLERASLDITYRVENLRRWIDPVNVPQAVKSAIDGLVDSRLLEDDRFLQLGAVLEEVGRPGVELRVRW